MAVQWCLSGIPRKLSDQIKREAYLTEELIIKREAARAKNKIGTDDYLLYNSNDNLRKRNIHTEFSENL